MKSRLPWDASRRSRCHPGMPYCIALVVLTSIPLAELRAQDRARERFDVAIGLLQRELWDEAAKQFRRFLRDSADHPLAPEARYRLGGCEEKLGNPARAIDAYVAALRTRGLRFRPECRYRAGKLLQSAKRYGEAATQLAALVDETEPRHYLRLAGTYALGECLRDGGKPKEALAAFMATAKAERDPAGTFGMPALYHAGFLHTAAGAHADAATCFEQAAQRFAKHEARPECLFLAGEAAFRAEEWQRAARGYRAAIDAGGRFVTDARYGLAWTRVRQDRVEDAIEAFAEVAAKDADSPLASKAQLEQGALLQRLGRARAAIPVLEALLKKSVPSADDRVRALEVLGLAQLDAGLAEDASNTFRTALRAGLDTATKARIAYDLGEALTELEQWRPATQAYDVAVEAGTEAKDVELVGDALYGAAVAFHELEEFGASIARASRIVDAIGAHRLAVEALFARAEGRFALSEWKRAEADYARIDPEHPLREQAVFKHAWCAYLDTRPGVAGDRFEAIAEDKGAFAEESLSLATLARFQAKDTERALVNADRYLVRYKDGKYLSRTERVAAQVLAQQDKLDAAATRVARAAAAEKDVTKARADRLQVGELLFRRGDYEAAGESYAMIAGESTATGAKALMGLAWCAFELGDDDDCEARIASALAHPKVGDEAASMLELLSSLHHRGKRFDKAEAAARTYLQRYPKHARAGELRYALGVALSRMERHADARRVLEALAADRVAAEKLERPDRLWYELAWARRKSKDETRALEAFAEVLKRSEDVELLGESRLHLGLARLAALGGASDKSKESKAVNDSAAAELLEAVEGRYRAQARYRLGFARFERGDLERAVPLFESILTLGPERSKSLFDEALFFAGECAYRQARRARAREAFENLLQRSPDGARAQLARLHVGHVDLEDGRPAAAIARLDEWIRRGEGEAQGDRAQAHVWLGRARVARKDWKAAITSFQVAEKLSDGPLGAEAQYCIGETHRLAGDRDAAIDAWLKLTILYGQDDWVAKGLLAAGEAYLAQDEKKKARKFLSELVERFGKSGEAQRARALLAKLRGE